MYFLPLFLFLRPDQVKKCLRYMRDRCDAAGGTCRKVPFVRCTCRRRTCKKTYRTVSRGREKMTIEQFVSTPETIHSFCDSFEFLLSSV